MMCNLVLYSREIRPPHVLLVHKFSLSEAVAKQLGTFYNDYRETTVQTVQHGIPRRVGKVDELMAFSNRHTVAICFTEMFVSYLNRNYEKAWEGSLRFNETLMLMPTSCSVISTAIALECLSFSFRQLGLRVWRSSRIP